MHNLKIDLPPDPGPVSLGRKKVEIILIAHSLRNLVGDLSMCTRA